MIKPPVAKFSVPFAEFALLFGKIVGLVRPRYLFVAGGTNGRICRLCSVAFTSRAFTAHEIIESFCTWLSHQHGQVIRFVVWDCYGMSILPRGIFAFNE